MTYASQIITVLHNDEIYRVETDNVGIVITAIRYYDHRMTCGEEITYQNIPQSVMRQVQKQIVKNLTKGNL